MRIPLLFGLLLSGAAFSYAQAPEPGKSGAANDDLTKIWSRLDPQGIARNQLSAQWRFDLQGPLQLPGQSWQPGKVAKDLWSSAIDPKSIVHPPPAALGDLSLGKPLMQDRFPGLLKMPVELPEGKSEAMLQPIPTQWPGLKLEAIPKTWPKLKIEGTLEGGSSSILPGPQ